MASQFKVGALVRSRVTAQGMLEGLVYEVVEVHTRRSFLGEYTSYVLAPVDPTATSPKRPVGNGHLLLDEVES